MLSFLSLLKVLFFELLLEPTCHGVGANLASKEENIRFSSKMRELTDGYRSAASLCFESLLNPAIPVLKEAAFSLDDLIFRAFS